jgi:hypothetical protein
MSAARQRYRQSNPLINITRTLTHAEIALIKDELWCLGKKFTVRRKEKSSCSEPPPSVLSDMMPSAVDCH